MSYTLDKRQFLKISGAIVAGSMSSRIGSSEETSAPRRNWAGNYQYSTDRLHTPSTVAEVQKIVKSSEKLKALGARHSFNGIADSTANQISLKNFTGMAVEPKVADRDGRRGCHLWPIGALPR
jgi:xylitol oxidase